MFTSANKSKLSDLIALNWRRVIGFSSQLKLGLLIAPNSRWIDVDAPPVNVGRPTAHNPKGKLMETFGHHISKPYAQMHIHSAPTPNPPPEEKVKENGGRSHFNHHIKNEKWEASCQNLWSKNSTLKRIRTRVHIKTYPIAKILFRCSSPNIIVATAH